MMTFSINVSDHKELGYDTPVWKSCPTFLTSDAQDKCAKLLTKFISTLDPERFENKRHSILSFLRSYSDEFLEVIKESELFDTLNSSNIMFTLSTTIEVEFVPSRRPGLERLLVLAHPCPFEIRIYTLEEAAMACLLHPVYKLYEYSFMKNIIGIHEEYFEKGRA